MTLAVRQGNHNKIAILICFSLLSPLLAEEPGKGVADIGTRTSNLFVFEDSLGRPVKNPLRVGDVTVTTKDSNRSSTAQVAKAWLSIDDRERDRWIKFEGYGESQKFDNYVKFLISNKRIL
jgi:hypothetical protein